MSRTENWTGERLETFVLDETTMEHLHRYAIALEYAEGKDVMDIACGEGYGSNLLAKKARHVTGVDIDKNTIEKARKKYTAANLQFVEGSLLQLDAFEAYDLITCFETLEHIKDHTALVQTLKRSLKKDGILLISTPNKKRYSDQSAYKNPFHEKELYEEEFRTLLNNSFSHVLLLNQQVIYSSIAVPASPSPLNMYTGNFDSITASHFPDPLYFIALASDKPLPPVNGSLFSGSSILEMALDKRERLVKQTLSYKLGHLLTYPLKLIRAGLSKKEKNE